VRRPGRRTRGTDGRNGPGPGRQGWWRGGVHYRRMSLGMVLRRAPRILCLRGGQVCLGSAGPQTVTKEFVVLGHELLGCQAVLSPVSFQNHVVPDQYLPTETMHDGRGSAGCRLAPYQGCANSADRSAAQMTVLVELQDRLIAATANRLKRPTWSGPETPTSSRQLAGGETGHGDEVSRRLRRRSRGAGGQVSIREVGMSGGFCHIVLRLVESGYRAPFSAARTNPQTGSSPLDGQPVDKTGVVWPAILWVRPRRSR
jgi:hypothetical protein